jgi:glycerol kinase
MPPFVLAIDQGTTSTRAIVFRADTSIAGIAQQEFAQHFPADGEVEHEPEDIWTTTLETSRQALRVAGAKANDIVAIGITNQREPLYCGIAPLAAPSIAPWSGRIDEARTSAHD